MASIKLQAFMAHAGVASRRASEVLIAEGKVRVNGEVAHIGQRVDTAQDKISVEGRQIGKPEKLRYFLIYKPVGYVSTTSDDLGRRTIVNILPPISERLYPVGRLDQDSEGLMMLTNDGDLAYKLTHPKHKIPKTYEVTVAGKPTYKALNLMKEGVKLKEGFTRPDSFEEIEEGESTTTYLMTIHQGYNRQVRRMFERIGYDVIKLKRISLGKFTLETLDNARFLELNQQEARSMS
jgi:pseudouridine synthase